MVCVPTRPQPLLGLRVDPKHFMHELRECWVGRVRYGVQQLCRLGYCTGSGGLFGNIFEETWIVNEYLADCSKPEDRQKRALSFEDGVVGDEFSCQILQREGLNSRTSCTPVEGPAEEMGHIPPGSMGRDQDGDRSKRIRGLAPADHCRKLSQSIAHRRKSTAGHAVPLILTSHTT
ncbi:hypothetical protein ASG92_12525 [Arthrobacter sp. Soil736]|nr:hypothetical protein ASG92_12525 [Arthrobacter sp. Soil736]